MSDFFLPIKRFIFDEFDQPVKGVIGNWLTFWKDMKFQDSMTRGVWFKSMYSMTLLFIQSTFEKIIFRNLSPKSQREMDEYFNFHKTLDNVPLSFLTQKMLLDILVLITFIVIWFRTLTLIWVIFSIALYMTGRVNTFNFIDVLIKYKWNLNGAFTISSHRFKNQPFRKRYHTIQLI